MGNEVSKPGIGRMLAALLALAVGACGGSEAQPDGKGARAGAVAETAGPAVPDAAWAMRTMAGDANATVGRRLVPTEVMDEAGFGQPMPALRLQVPEGWQARGGIAWNDAAECWSGQVQVAWVATSADGASALELLPGLAWQVQGTELPTDPCPVAPYRSVREFLEAAAQHHRPGSRVLDYSDWPALADKAQARAERDPRPLAPGQSRRFEAGRLLIGWRAPDGADMREVLVANASFWGMQAKRDGSVGRVLAYRAPHGRMDFDVVERIGESLEDDPQWFALANERVTSNVQRYYADQRADIEAWHARRMAQINQRGEADRAAIRAGALRDVAAIRSRTHANTMATNDRIHARGVDAMLERNAYAGAHGGPVYSSIHEGQRVFQNPDRPEQAWSTDDPYANPANAVELERIR